MDLRYCGVKAVEGGNLDAREYSDQLSGINLLILTLDIWQL